MIRELYKDVLKILEENKEYQYEQIFLLVAKYRGFKTPEAIVSAMWYDKLDFTYEGVSRTVRAIRKEREDLRDKEYSKRVGVVEKKVRNEVIELSKEQREIKEFATKNIKQGSIF